MDKLNGSVPFKPGLFMRFLEVDGVKFAIGYSKEWNKRYKVLRLLVGRSGKPPTSMLLLKTLEQMRINDNQQTTIFVLQQEGLQDLETSELVQHVRNGAGHSTKNGPR